MSDEASPTKRGRKAAVEKIEKVVETKKRARKEVKPASEDEGSDGGDAPSPAKRGRGRPKGTTKKKAGRGRPSAAAAAATGGRRGRPKKAEEKPADEDNEENDDAAEEEEDDE